MAASDDLGIGKVRVSWIIKGERDTVRGVGEQVIQHLDPGHIVGAAGSGGRYVAGAISPMQRLRNELATEAHS